jgi:drug/metabolite transporter (DMT)-like permease
MIPAALDRLRVPGTLRWGIVLAFATALISGFSIFINGFAVKQVPDAAVFTTLKNAVAAVALLGLAAVAVRPAELRSIRPRSWASLIAIGIVGGSLPFLLFFGGLAIASAPSAAFIHKTLFIWVALLAVPFLGERLGWLQVGALGVLLGGQALLLSPAGMSWGLGETMIAAATLLWSIETIVAKRVLRGVPAPVVGAARLGFGLVILAGYLVVTGKLALAATLGAEQWRWILVTGLLLFGYVGTWYAALQRAPASAVTSILVLGAPVTAAIQVVATGSVPAVPALAGHLLLLTGGALVAVWSIRRPVARPARS